MSKIAVVYWSGTGNTEAMANAVVYGAETAGAEAELITCGDFNAERMDEFDEVAFGCPSMGSEELEECEFAPMFESVKGKLSGKRIALFGSYGWGDGEWMRNWEADCRANGAELLCDPVICAGEPEAETVKSLNAIGAELSR